MIRDNLLNFNHGLYKSYTFSQILLKRECEDKHLKNKLYNKYEK